jgi:Sulfotransferase domain
MPIPFRPSLLKHALRKLNCHRTTELYFIGYPKTGNTWIRYMLGLYVQKLFGLEYAPLFDDTDKLGRCQKFCTAPTMQFTHWPLVWHGQRAKDLDFGNVVGPFLRKRIVLIVRHPLDALVSHWLQRKHRGSERYEGDLIEFLDDEVWGLQKYFRFYSLWHEHNECVREFFLIRYEDLRQNPFLSFSRLLEFLALPVRGDELRLTISDADFGHMRKMEEAGLAPAYPSSCLNIFGLSNVADPESYHVRRGKVEGYRDYLKEHDIRHFTSMIKLELPSVFGY